MPKALGILNNVLKADLVESEKAALVADFDKVLGLRLDIPREDYEKKTEGVDATEIESLIALRSEARKAKNWAESDRIRDVLADKGIVIKDSPQGTTWSVN
jgi:cysteinyl-tRNA synthetase